MDFPGLIWVSTLVKDQKPGINAVCDEPVGAGQRDINGMRVTTKIVGCFKQRDIGFALQRMGCCKPRNARPHNGNTLLALERRVGGHQRAEDKNVAKRPDANKVGREEENRSGIASKARRLRRLRNNETEMPQFLATSKSMSWLSAKKFPCTDASEG